MHLVARVKCRTRINAFSSSLFLASFFFKAVKESCYIWKYFQGRRPGEAKRIALLPSLSVDLFYASIHFVFDSLSTLTLSRCTPFAIRRVNRCCDEYKAVQGLAGDRHNQTYTPHAVGNTPRGFKRVDRIPRFSIYIHISSTISICTGPCFASFTLYFSFLFLFSLKFLFSTFSFFSFFIASKNFSYSFFPEFWMCMVSSFEAPGGWKPSASVSLIGGPCVWCRNPHVHRCRVPYPHHRVSSHFQLSGFFFFKHIEPCLRNWI